MVFEQLLHSSLPGVPQLNYCIQFWRADASFVDWQTLQTSCHDASCVDQTRKINGPQYSRRLGALSSTSCLAAVQRGNATRSARSPRCAFTCILAAFLTSGVSPLLSCLYQNIYWGPLGCTVVPQVEEVSLSASAAFYFSPTHLNKHTPFLHFRRRKRAQSAPRWAAVCLLMLLNVLS